MDEKNVFMNIRITTLKFIKKKFKIVAFGTLASGVIQI